MCAFLASCRSTASLRVRSLPIAHAIESSGSVCSVVSDVSLCLATSIRPWETGVGVRYGDQLLESLGVL